jgi:Family of unknown function (DUF6069)
MSTTMAIARTIGPASRSLRRSRPLIVLGAAAATLTVWVVAHALDGVELRVRLGSGTDGQAVGPAAVALATIVAGLAGWVLLAALERFTPRARGLWTVAATVGPVVSLAGPLGSGVTTGAKLSLMGMHLAAAAILIPLLARSSARQ